MMEAQFRCGYKCRFSLKLPDGSIRRFGSCRTTDDDNYAVELAGDAAVLVHLEPGGTGAVLGREPLPAGTLITAGYYDHEHVEWLSLTPETAKLATAQRLR